MRFSIYLITFFIVFKTQCSFAQTNIISTNPLAEQIMLGNYNPDNYLPSSVITNPDEIISIIKNEVSTDSLKDYLIRLSEFKTRNSGSDTTSLVVGIGASRRWVHDKFMEFSAQNDNRLIPSYLQFDLDICGMMQHRNVFAVLPGKDTTDKSVIIIEAHMDSRCDVLCDVSCKAEGVEDNASGTALVIELARVMAQFSFNRTLIFMATIGEEQGLHGAHAFAQYAVNTGMEIKAVLNNDIVGGITCGETSSPPSCPGENHIDSTQIRLFSSGSTTPHKNLARYIQLQYKEEFEGTAAVPMLLKIMAAEDRAGRGGDHIPFRQRGFPAMRFTSANEHGDASNGPDYHDRQHTSEDILGVDTDGDLIIDSFFVNFNYLARNTVINGMAASLIGRNAPSPNLTGEVDNGIISLQIDDPLALNHYRIGVLTTGIDFDTLITLIGTNTFQYTPPEPNIYHITVASVDELGFESCFSSTETFIVFPTGIENHPTGSKSRSAIELLQNRPNPFDESTYISFYVHEPVPYQNAYIQITDLNGKHIREIPTNVLPGLNEVIYFHGYKAVGTYVYSLFVDENLIGTKTMVFAN